MKPVYVFVFVVTLSLFSVGYAADVDSCSALGGNENMFVEGYNTYSTEISTAADIIRDRIDHPEALIAAIISGESGWNPYAVSPCASGGIAQFIPRTARDYGLQVPVYDFVTCRFDICKTKVSACNSCSKDSCLYSEDERFNAAKAIDALAKHMSDLIERCGDLNSAILAYNSGACGVEANKGYLSKIKKYYKAWSSCLAADEQNYANEYYEQNVTGNTTNVTASEQVVEYYDDEIHSEEIWNSHFKDAAGVVSSPPEVELPLASLESETGAKIIIETVPFVYGSETDYVNQEYDKYSLGGQFDMAIVYDADSRLMHFVGSCYSFNNGVRDLILGAGHNKEALDNGWYDQAFVQIANEIYYYAVENMGSTDCSSVVEGSDFAYDADTDVVFYYVEDEE